MPKQPGMEDAGGNQPHYLGHRDRLRLRFTDLGEQNLADYELLELLLFRSIPRADTKPIAKGLIDRFGSFAEVLAAPTERLVEVKGVGQRVAGDIKSIHAAALRFASTELKSRETIGDWDKLITYCRTAMALEPREQFRVLFLDKRNGLLADEVMQQGTVDHTPAYPREIVRRAIELGSTALILVHNHPSGDPSPSRADIDMTAKIVQAANTLNIAVHDHIIVGRDDHMSFRDQGMLDR